MAADVSTLVRILNGYLDEQTETGRNSISNSHDLITRDLFSGGGGRGGGGTTSSSRTPSSKDVDLDLQVPSGWEKRLDLQSGKVYLQRCKTPQIHRQDLNYPPTTKASSSSPTVPTAAVLEEEKEKGLDLKLVPSYDYRSVCTLDKVKSALERAGKEDMAAKKRSSSSTTSGSSSIRDEDGDGDEGRSSSLSGGGGGSYSSSGLLFAGGCPSCLMYVMISKMNPKCPRCDSVVPTPPSMVNKKPKIDLDLNLNLMSSSW